jgi:signal recognition particle receptor subunit beta
LPKDPGVFLVDNSVKIEEDNFDAVERMAHYIVYSSLFIINIVIIINSSEISTQPPHIQTLSTSPHVFQIYCESFRKEFGGSY